MIEDKYCSYVLKHISSFTLWGGVKRSKSIPSTQSSLVTYQKKGVCIRIADSLC